MELHTFVACRTTSYRIAAIVVGKCGAREGDSLATCADMCRIALALATYCHASQPTGSGITPYSFNTYP